MGYLYRISPALRKPPETKLMSVKPKNPPPIKPTKPYSPMSYMDKTEQLGAVYPKESKKAKLSQAFRAPQVETPDFPKTKAETAPYVASKIVLHAETIVRGLDLIGKFLTPNYSIQDDQLPCCEPHCKQLTKTGSEYFPYCSFDCQDWAFQIQEYKI